MYIWILKFWWLIWVHNTSSMKITWIFLLFSFWCVLYSISNFEYLNFKFKFEYPEIYPQTIFEFLEPNTFEKKSFRQLKKEEKLGNFCPRSIIRYQVLKIYSSRRRNLKYHVNNFDFDYKISKFYISILNFLCLIWIHNTSSMQITRIFLLFSSWCPILNISVLTLN